MIELCDKCKEKIEEWWKDLDESEKIDVLEGIYPNEVGLIDSDELWYRTGWKIKLESYKE